MHACMYVHVCMHACMYVCMANGCSHCKVKLTEDELPHLEVIGHEELRHGVEYLPSLGIFVAGLDAAIELGDNDLGRSGDCNRRTIE